MDRPWLICFHNEIKRPPAFQKATWMNMFANCPSRQTKMAGGPLKLNTPCNRMTMLVKIYIYHIYIYTPQNWLWHIPLTVHGWTFFPSFLGEVMGWASTRNLDVFVSHKCVAKRFSLGSDVISHVRFWAEMFYGSDQAEVGFAGAPSNMDQLKLRVTLPETNIFAPENGWLGY